MDLVLYLNSLLRKYCMREKCGDSSTHLESLRWWLNSGKFPLKEELSVWLSEPFSIVTG